MPQLEQVLGAATRVIASSSTGLRIFIAVKLVMYPITGAIGGLIGSNLMRPKSV